MFLNLFQIIKLPVTSNASRSIYKFYNTWCLAKKIKHLSFLKKWKAGRNDSGQIVFRTRKSLLHKYKTLKINYNFRYNKLGFIASFQLIPFKNKLVTLMYFANGAITYFLSAESHKIFRFSLINHGKKIKKFSLKSFFLALHQIKKLSFVSALELIPGKGAQYVRSNGTSAKLLSFDKNKRSVLVKLPSGVKKIFSYYSFATLGKITFPETKKCDNTKSGYWRSFGIKSMVRGVAMNPVDHPHGGRTKTIKYPLTPWGKTTKFK